MASFAVTGQEQLQALARDLRAAGDEGKGLRRNLRRNLKAAMDPIRDAVQAAALSIPAEGNKSTGLRQAIAKATTTNISIAQKHARARIQVTPKKMPDGQAALPPLMEGVARWRHPVYGNSKAWVSQTPHPYFYRTVEARLALVETALQAAINDTAAAIERGTT